MKYLLLVLSATTLIAAGCDNTTSSSYDYESDYSNGYSYEEVEEPTEPENPYSSYEEGHSAGYEWAQENEVDNCGGNSNSFIEGCEEYLYQRDEYEQQQSEYDEWENSQQDYEYEYPY